MDYLDSLIALSHMKVRLERLTRNPSLVFETESVQPMATPKLQSLATAMAKLEHNLEYGAGELLTKIEAVGSRGVAAITKGHSKVDGIGTRVAEVESFVAALEGANGGDPLESSAPTSDAPKLGPNGGPRITGA